MWSNMTKKKVQLEPPNMAKLMNSIHGSNDASHEINID